MLAGAAVGAFGTAFWFEASVSRLEVFVSLEGRVNHHGTSTNTNVIGTNHNAKRVRSVMIAPRSV